MLLKLYMEKRNILLSVQLIIVKQERKTISQDLKIRLFSKLDNSQRRNKILCLSQCILDIVKEEKGNTLYPTDQIKLKQIKFETCDDLYNILFEKLDKIKTTIRIEGVVKSLDKNHISRKAYQSLEQIEQDISCEKAVSRVLN
ncbi:13033_t:CDS:2, partial [Funneliformis geosporum]